MIFDLAWSLILKSFLCLFVCVSSLTGRARAALIGRYSAGWQSTMRQSCSRRSLWTGPKQSCHHQRKSASSYLSRRCIKSHTCVFFVSPSIYLLDCGSNSNSNSNSVNVARKCWLHTGTKTNKRRKWMLIRTWSNKNWCMCIYLWSLSLFSLRRPRGENADLTMPPWCCQSSSRPFPQSWTG